MPASVKDELQRKYLCDSPNHVLFKDLLGTVRATALWGHFEEKNLRDPS